MTTSPKEVHLQDAAVVDNEALQALRAVLRMLPQDSGGKNEIITGSIKAVEGVATERAIVAGGRARGPQAEKIVTGDQLVLPVIPQLEPLDFTPSTPNPLTQDSATPGRFLLGAVAPRAFHTNIPHVDSSVSAPSILVPQPEEPPVAETPTPTEPLPQDPLVTHPPRTEPPAPEEPQPEEPPVAETPTPTEPLPQDPLVTHPPRTEPPAPEEPQPEEPPSIGSSGNPGNGKSVGNAGESPNGSDFGEGSHGRSDAANDVPQSVLVSTEYADANEHHVDTFSLVQTEARDSARLGGATVILSDAQPGDMFVLDGYALHIENGRTMIGDTGIELVGGYAAEMGALTLSGNAPPETYAAVLRSLVLESCDASGPATGSKSIRVTLLDSEGVASMQTSVDIVLEDVQSSQAESSSGADALSQTSQIDLDASYLVLISDSDANGNSSASGSWIEEIESGGSSGSTVNTIVDLNHPSAEHVQSLDDLNVDLGRVHWSCQ